jgi:ubiquinone/menaquinone biosynthesis C-methylase UbiE
MSRNIFYKRFIKNNIKDLNAKILVLGAGALDKKIFDELNFANVVYSNFNSKIEDQKDFKNILLQEINLKDNSYEYCVAHACVHHSSKPHNAILEMYRVASKGILVIEANDCLLTRIACKLGLAEEFEKTATLNNNLSGGVDNTNIPNFVYRWTEREIYKLISSYKPNSKHDINFVYDYDLKFTKNILIKFLFDIFFKIFKKQQNLLAIYINKN